MTKGKFITFEGIDGAGKSTSLHSLAKFLKNRGEEVFVTREPGGTELGEDMRHLFLKHPMDGVSELLLLFAARHALVKEIRAALDKGQWVLCDRFIDSSYAYQGGGRGVSTNLIEVLEKNTIGNLMPDKTILFDIPVEVARQRLAQQKKDRFDGAPLTFHQKVKDAFLARAKQNPERFIIIDATNELSVIEKTLEKYIISI